MPRPTDQSGSRRHLIDASELVAGLADPDLRVIDARFELLDPPAGRAQYLTGHVPGAVHLDLDRDLSSAPGAVGGRHPLPDMTRFAERLGAAGVGRDNRVVVYDQNGGMYAARAWWLLRYAGHERVYFLDGGLDAYLRAGGELSTEPPRWSPTEFALDVRSDMIASVDEVERRLQDDGLVLLDARAPERYRGEVEPLDSQAGHIPGARNLPFTVAQGADGLLSEDALRQRLGVDHLTGREVVAYCGSGVSAAHLILSLAVAGRDGVRLYPGSWSEWSRDPRRPVATGTEGTRRSVGGGGG